MPARAGRRPREIAAPQTQPVPSSSSSTRMWSPRQAFSRGYATVFTQRPELAAVFGAYDERPRDAGFISQYRNLSHSYFHQTSNAEARTFWAGLGAIRREAFDAVGGFDERFGRPSVEDIDFGYRMSGLGYKILLDPTIRGCHLKRWTLRSAIVSDLRDRGIPWTQLMLKFARLDNDLNVQTQSAACRRPRLRAPAAPGPCDDRASLVRRRGYRAARPAVTELAVLCLLRSAPGTLVRVSRVSDARAPSSVQWAVVRARVRHLLRRPVASAWRCRAQSRSADGTRQDRWPRWPTSAVAALQPSFACGFHGLPLCR